MNFISFQADINALKWCKYTGASCSLDRPLDDPVLASFASALDNNVLCSWRHSPPYTTQRLNQGLTCPESAKELWLFWYGDDPRSINIVDGSLKGLFEIISFLDSLSLTSNTDTNNKSCAYAVLAKKQRRSVLEVATTEVKAILVVVGIERQTYINPVFYSFLNKDIKYLFKFFVCLHGKKKVYFCRNTM